MPKDTNISIDISADGSEVLALAPGEYAIHAGGTFGGGTLTVYWVDGANSAAFPDGALTASGGLIIAVGSPQVGFVLSGATGANISITGNRI